MIRFALSEVLERRGITAYELAGRTGIPIPTAYRLADSSYRHERLSLHTLNLLCNALQVLPEDLLIWSADREDG